jgi:beta-glucanase (GH16 family)
MAVLLAALTLSCTAEPSATKQHHPRHKPKAMTSAAARAVTPHSLQLAELPPIAQTGAVDTAADAASSVFVATAEPARSRAVLTLQERRSSQWQDVADASTNGRGLAVFAVPKADRARPMMHRVVAKAQPRVRSTVVADGWHLTFSDEFGGSALGPKWSYRALGVLSANSGRKVSASSKDAVQVRDGTLRLQMKPDPSKPGYYLNGHISTEKSFLFKYGVAAARIKFERPRGSHGAFWSQSPTFGNPPGDPAAAGTEIDIGEYFGQGFGRGGLASYVYHADKSGSLVKSGDVLRNARRVVGSPDAFWRRYHVYSVEWSPKGYVFRIDGRTTYQTTKAVSQRTQFLILSLLSSDWELPNLDKRLLPATMQVDWVRVWQRPLR